MDHTASDLFFAHKGIARVLDGARIYRFVGQTRTASGLKADNPFMVSKFPMVPKSAFGMCEMTSVRPSTIAVISTH